MVWWSWVIIGILTAVAIAQLVLSLILISKIQHMRAHNRKLYHSNKRYRVEIQQLKRDCYNFCVGEVEAKIGLENSEKLRKQAEGKLKVANALVIKGTFRRS